MYKLVENIISESECDALIEYLEKQTNHTEQLYLKTVIAPYTHIIPIPDEKQFPQIEIILNRIKNIIGVRQTITGSPERYGTGIVFSPKGALTESHYDPIDRESNPYSVILRTNILLKSSTRGGVFYIENNGEKNYINIPERSLIIFNSSDYLHGVTKNLGNTSRIILLSDCIVTKEYAQNILAS